jgi:protein-tyrosine-phosphatase/DNA-binding transcriptional ArsR family regulator
LQLAGHEVRWRLLRELARSDLQVRELTSLVGQPQSLVSYHLGRLRAGRLVSMRRSSADRRDAYYSLDLSQCRELLASAGGALHPGLRLAPPPARRGGSSGSSGSARPTRVLFLCTGNSARSQMAEALLERATGPAVEAVSAGSHPKALHADAVRAMAERGIDISGWRTKHLDEFTAERFDYVVTLCDRVREVCPDFPGPAERVHWSIPDPSAEAAAVPAEESYPIFQRTADDIETRVGFLVHRIEDRIEHRRTEHPTAT